MWVAGPRALPPSKPAVGLATVDTEADGMAPPLSKLRPYSDVAGGGDGDGDGDGVSNAVTATGPPAGAALGTLRLYLADLAMILCQLMLFINHYRRLLDAICAATAAGGTAATAPCAVLPAPGPLAAYPCSAPTIARLAFLAARAGATLAAALRLSGGELWVPLVTAAILAQLAALAMMPRRTYVAYGRRACMVAVGLLPKAVSLATFLALPDERPSTYFGTYLPMEGVIVIWQQVVYNYPLWQGMAVLASHCALSTAICLTVAPRLLAAGAPPLFRPGWVLAQTYCCASLAALVTLQQQPAAVRKLLASAAAALRDRGRGGSGGAWQPNGDGAVATAAAAMVAAAAAEDTQLKAAVRKMLSSSNWCSSSTSVASGSFTGMTPSASFGSSAMPSEPSSTAGSGSHTAAAQAAGVAQAAAAAVTDFCRPDAAPKSLLAQRLPQNNGHVAGLTASAKLLTYESRAKLLSSQGPADNAAVLGIPAVASPLLMCPVGAVHVSHASPPGRALTVAAAPPPSPPSGALPPAGAFSLKQPTGLSKWTIAEDQEFQAPAAVGVGVSLNTLDSVGRRGRSFRRYHSRALPQRVHMKLPWAEPDQLPGNFLERLNLALSEGLDCMAVGVSVRAGCIELVFDIVPQGEGAGRAAFDSACDFQAGQSRLRHVQQQQQQQQHHLNPQCQHRSSNSGSTGAEAAHTRLPRLLQASPSQPQLHQRLPGHLDLLGQAGALGAEALGAAVGDRDSDDGDQAAAADPHGALEAAILSGLLRDADPASWIDALHLQPPPGAEVLTQACGRVWISRWDPMLRQWVPQKVGGIRPSQLPRITQLTPPCVVVRPREAPAAAGGSPWGISVVGDCTKPVGPQAGGEALRGPIPTGADSRGGGAVVRVTVTNAGGATPPAFSARCCGRYLPVVARRVRTAPDDLDWQSNGDGECRGEANSDLPGATALPSAAAAAATFELELPAGLPRNGLVVVECKVGKLLSNWRPLIVTEDAFMAAELASLLAPPPPPTPATAATRERGDPDDSSHLSPLASPDPAASAAAGDTDGGAVGWDDLANDLGLWLDYLEVLGLTKTAGGAAGAIDEAEDEVEVALLPGSLDLGPGLAALYATKGYGAHMAGIGASLLEFAVDRGWVHTAEMLVRQMLSAGLPWSEMLSRCSSDGLTLLHRAVRSGRSEAVELVVRLGEEHGTPFDWQAVSLGGAAAAAAEGGEISGDGGGASGAGVTPLHLAASLPDGGRLAERILHEYHAACELWASAVDSYGMRPVDCARASGHVHLTGHPSGMPHGTQARDEGAAEAGAAAAAAAAAVSPPLLSKGRLAAAPNGAVGTNTTSSSSVEMASTGGGGGVEADSAGGSSRLRRVPGVAALAAALRGAAELLAAPLVGDARVEAAYVRAVGAEFVLWGCGYAVYQICTVAAVAGRMVKELRAHEMVGMLLFCSPHLATAALLYADYGAWLRLREPLSAAVTMTRSAAKLLPVLGLLPYPNSTTNYLSGGMDILLEGLVPAYFERMRAPLVLLLRALEGLATGLLYRAQRVELRLAPPGMPPLAYALAWTLGCGVLTAALDAACRRRFTAATAAATAAADGPAAGRAAGVRARVGAAGLIAGGTSSAQATAAAGVKGKKVD